MKKYIFLFTMGPVQSFISEARKVRDLAAGSAILSQLVEEAIRFLQEDKKVLLGKNLIFPTEELINKPNRFLAYVETKEVEQLGIDLENHVKKHFLTKSQNLLKKYYDKELIGKALSQLEDILKIFWVIIPISNEYHKDYLQVERLLGGIKNLRAFNQFTEIGRKCAINGNYNANIYHLKDTDKPKNNPPIPYWLSYTNDVTIKKNIEYGLLSKGEALSTINFYKRIYPLEEESYEATCQIAYLDVIDILHTKAPLATKKLVELNEQYLYNDTPIKREDDNHLVHSYREKVKQILKSEKVKLPKYYAVLMLDADKMGKWLSGEFLDDKNQLLWFQKELSRLFGTFAQFAKNYVDGFGMDGIKKGQTIYAGGDDFLGLINLKYLFDVLKKLIGHFKNTVWKELSSKVDFIDTTKPMSFSAGVTIAHYKTPLSYVLKETKRAEKIAKDKANRNSLCITVLKRSGEVHQSYFKWFDSEGKYLLDYFFGIINTLIQKKSSNKFITSFTRLFMPLADRNKHPGINEDIIRLELKRLLKDNLVISLEHDVIQLFNHLYNDKGRLVDFIFLLNIADFISREVNCLKDSNTICS